VFAEKINGNKILEKLSKNNGMDYVFSFKKDGIYMQRSAVEGNSEII
jgi:hypothetical protein